MQFLLSLVLALGTVSAAPFELISKRALGDHEMILHDKRDENACPAHLKPGQFEFPHYITQVSSNQPDRAFGPQYRGRVTPNDISSIFSFDVPQDRADANCTLEFLFPTQDVLKTSYYKFDGPGTFRFTGYLAGSCPDSHTTYNNQPQPGNLPAFPPIHMEPGFAYTIDVGPCTFSAGKCVSGMLSSTDTSFEFFQDQGNCPIGIYNTYSYGLPCPEEYCG
ncbi:ubiquitin 3 binding protein But2 C-terminal domain-containing protein [Annulohypoxylon maeteangense]|uniref:ubiquitin 3 binding protein But2 C-terminal domain-containing protein n=1 Tax=Annulohypoxylon maeteangense TaxID=1927788 RepID=UPI0020083168|nr:ubiquitin 3 binding protein But2 C-terminal domain-containing protein [Annulohypoxylon maeteangense]KAI0886834.1 ubiquitin 3 binding protein But2 C-terminal domain-containing protein [Annulohypoxylon maeteangense]